MRAGNKGTAAGLVETFAAERAARQLAKERLLAGRDLAAALHNLGVGEEWCEGFVAGYVGDELRTAPDRAWHAGYASGVLVALEIQQ